MVSSIVRCYQGRLDRLSAGSEQTNAADSLASDAHASDTIFDALALAFSPGSTVKEAELMVESGADLQQKLAVLSTDQNRCYCRCQKCQTELLHT